MSTFSYGTVATWARAIAASVAASTSPLVASTPRCSRYAVAARSVSCRLSKYRDGTRLGPERVGRPYARAAPCLHVPLAGEQPRHEAVEQSQRHAPEDVSLHLDALDFDRPLEVARRERQLSPLGRFAEVRDGWGEEPDDLVRLRLPVDIGRHEPEERIDAETGGHRLERVERGQYL